MFFDVAASRQECRSRGERGQHRFFQRGPQGAGRLPTKWLNQLLPKFQRDMSQYFYSNVLFYPLSFLGELLVK